MGIINHDTASEVKRYVGQNSAGPTARILQSFHKNKLLFIYSFEVFLNTLGGDNYNQFCGNSRCFWSMTCPSTNCQPKEGKQNNWWQRALRPAEYFLSFYLSFFTLINEN